MLQDIRNEPICPLHSELYLRRQSVLKIQEVMCLLVTDSKIVSCQLPLKAIKHNWTCVFVLFPSYVVDPRDAINHTEFNFSILNVSIGLFESDKSLISGIIHFFNTSLLLFKNFISLVGVIECFISIECIVIL
jgi:hypothetical protein